MTSRIVSSYNQLCQFTVKSNSKIGFKRRQSLSHENKLQQQQQQNILIINLHHLVRVCVCTSCGTAVVLLATHKQCECSQCQREWDFMVRVRVVHNRVVVTDECWDHASECSQNEKLRLHLIRHNWKKPFHASLTLTIHSFLFCGMPNNYKYIFLNACFAVWNGYLASS